MAFIQRPFHLRLAFIDNDGAESTCNIRVPESAGAGAALSFLLGWRSVVLPLTSATCTAGDVITSWRETTPAPPAGSAVGRRSGTFILDTGAGGLATVRVPSILESLLLPTGPFAGIAIDLAAPAVVAFVSAITSGIGGTQPCDLFSNDLVSVNQAYKEQF